jgi:predicted nucleotidyltransferase
MTTLPRERLGIKEIVGPYREAILEITARYGAHDVRVFGSVARGEAAADSDLDLLVTWDYAHMTPWGSAALWDELEALLGRPVDITSERGLNPFIRDAVIAEAIPL